MFTCSAANHKHILCGSICLVLHYHDIVSRMFLKLIMVVMNLISILRQGMRERLMRRYQDRLCTRLTHQEIKSVIKSFQPRGNFPRKSERSFTDDLHSQGICNHIEDSHAIYSSVAVVIVAMWHIVKHIVGF